MVLAVSEDWSPSGAGNSLHTLYAFRKANLAAKEKYGVDLETEFGERKISAAAVGSAAGA
jgi:hypothetical protein